LAEKAIIQDSLYAKRKGLPWGLFEENEAVKNELTKTTSCYYIF
jgi:hypothetical protein